MSKKKVLYICNSGVFGGATRSLYELLKGLPQEKYDFYFISSAGTTIPFYKSISVDLIESRGISKIDNTKYSYYRGLRWLILLRELLFLPYTIHAFYKAKKQWGKMDMIHLNEITNIPALILSGIFFKDTPIVMHVRSINRRAGFMAPILERIISKRVRQIVAIDNYVKESLPYDKVKIVHNSMSMVQTETDTKLLERLKEIGEGGFKIGFVGNFLKSKGLEDLVEAFVMLKREGLPIKCLVLGDQIRREHFLGSILTALNITQDPKKEILEKIAANELEHDVVLLGKSYDLSSFYSHIDVLCFPSHLEAPGRPVFESAFYKKPSIVAVAHSDEDCFVDKETGLAVLEKTPSSIYEAIKYFYDHPEEHIRMGNNAYDMAMKNFNQSRNSKKMDDIYDSLI